MRLANANVLTLDPDGSAVEALEVVDGQVAGAGTTVGPVIDCNGHTIVPGFVEAHCHFRGWALQHHRLRLAGSTPEQAVDALEAWASALPPAGWVLGGGWDDAQLDAFEDPAATLELATDGRPAALHSRDSHAMWTTPATLALLGLDLEALDVPGGIVDRDASGRFTGVLREESAWMLRRALPSDDLTTAVMHEACLEAARRGVTTVHDMDGSRALATWLETERERPLPVRVVVHLLEPDLDQVDQLRASVANSDRVTLGHLKCFADGTLGSGTALLHEPEIPRPGHATRSGVRITGPDHLRDLARRAGALGLPIAVHAIGDLAFTEVLDALEATRDAWAHLAMPPRIEHAQLVRHEDLTRAAALGVLLVVQPTMLRTDREEATARWGEERCRRAYAYRSMLDAGCRIALSSDAPIEDVRPLDALDVATTRAGWNPSEALDPMVALAASVATPLTPGAPADLVVLSDDPRVVGWSEVRVVATMLEGDWTYDTLAADASAASGYTGAT